MVAGGAPGGVPIGLPITSQYIENFYFWFFPLIRRGTTIKIAISATNSDNRTAISNFRNTPEACQSGGRRREGSRLVRFCRKERFVKIFIAGATGAVGLPLVRVLCALGHQVTGMTRAGSGVDLLREVGATPSFADAFDPVAVRAAIEAASPDVVIDQLTWLPANPADIIKAMPNDTRLHRDGGANLLAAAEELGVSRYIVQSRGFYLDAPPAKLADETASLRYDAPGEIGDSARVIGKYEDNVLAAASLDGVVLRYGFFYGPGTWYRPNGAIADQVRKQEAAVIGEGNAVWSFVHIDDAVAATVAALTSATGVYNIVDDDPLPVSEWLPAFARWVDAPEPPRLSVEDALKAAGEEAVYYHTRLTGASNSRARRELGFTPRPLLWKSGAA